MILNEGGKEYLIREYSAKKKSGEIVLEWRAAKGTHFFVIAYDCRRELCLEKLVNSINDKLENDESIARSTKNKLFEDEKDDIKVFCYKQQEFLSNGQGCVFNANELKSSVPYGLAVYIGEYDVQDKNMYIYDPNSEDNTEYIPVAVKADIKYNTKLFSNKKICKLYIPYIHDYEDGAIVYHVSGVYWDFPITKRAVGKTITIIIPKDSDVNIRIADDYKKYYKKV